MPARAGIRNLIDYRHPHCRGADGLLNRGLPVAVAGGARAMHSEADMHYFDGGWFCVDQRLARSSSRSSPKPDQEVDGEREAVHLCVQGDDERLHQPRAAPLAPALSVQGSGKVPRMRPRS